MVVDSETFTNILLLLALTAIYLGFAGFLGGLLYRARRGMTWYKQIGLFTLTLATFLGISLAIHWGSRSHITQMLGAYLVILLFSLRPIRRPQWIWRASMGFRYLSLTLMLVVLWAVNVEFHLPRIILAPFAALAAILAWGRSREKPEDVLVLKNTPVRSFPAEQQTAVPPPPASSPQSPRGAV
jgi:hypothetical protein